MYSTEQTRQAYEFWSKNLKGRHGLEDLHIDGYDLKWIVKEESVNWIYLTQDMGIMRRLQRKKSFELF
jgi:hypothetical protein